MHAHLSHLGSDLCRGLLLFADARPLGRGSHSFPFPLNLSSLCSFLLNLS